MALTPTTYNIQLLRYGNIINFDFAPAIASDIVRFGWLIPDDSRCVRGLVKAEDDLLDILKPVLGTYFNGDLNYKTVHQAVVALHDTAILGYQKQQIQDPRLGLVIAHLYEVYLDKRIFIKAEDDAWLRLMGDLISYQDDKALAEDIKNTLLQQAGAK